MLLTALAIDNIGTGLFLPLAVVYATRAVGLDVADAGTTIAVASSCGLVVPAVAGRLVHAVGPRLVVIGSQLVQLAGAVAYLVASGVTGVFTGALLMACGAQLFYCSVFLLLANAVPGAAKERTFAVVGMVRAGAFGAGNLIGAVGLSVGGAEALRWVVAVNAASFAAAAVLQAALVRGVGLRGTGEEPAVSPLRVARDGVFLRLIAVTFLLALTTDFALVGVPVYLLDELDTAAWLPGVVLAWSTVLGTVFGLRVVDLFRPVGGPRSLAVGGVTYAVFCGLMMTAGWLPGGAAVAGYVLVATTVWAAANKVFYPFTNSLSLDLSPPGQRPAYLATFQYSFALAQVLAPAVVALFAVNGWFPWVLVGAVACTGAVLTRRLPAAPASGA